MILRLARACAVIEYVLWTDYINSLATIHNISAFLRNSSFLFQGQNAIVCYLKPQCFLFISFSLIYSFSIPKQSILTIKLLLYSALKECMYNIDGINLSDPFTISPLNFLRCSFFLSYFWRILDIHVLIIYLHKSLQFVHT